MSQISFFDGQHKLLIEKPIRLIETFAGIGAQAKALENLGVPFEHYRICEYDKYAVKSYNAIHGTNFEPTDITKIGADDLGITNTDNYCYILTYSFPCQSLSKAGKQHGMSKGGGTRSGLLWEVERLLSEMTELPQILLMENVPDVVSDKFIGDFAEWIAFLDSLGYRSKYEILNAKNYGIPQNRERCFMVSWLGDYYYDFPEPIPLKHRLKDVLEPVVEEKYYLSDEQVKSIIGVKENVSDAEPSYLNYRKCDKQNVDVAKTIMARDYKGFNTGFDTMNGVVEPKIAIPQAVKQGYIECELGGVADLSYPNSKTRCGRVQEGGSISPTITAESNGICRIEPRIGAIRGRNLDNPSDRTAGTPTEQRLEVGGDCSNTLTTVQKDNVVIEPSIRVRKLAPKECFRLMGFEDADFDKASVVNSNTQLMKQAGNSIVVNVLCAIFGQMFEGKENMYATLQKNYTKREAD